MKWVTSFLLRHPMTDHLTIIAHQLVKKGLIGYDVCYAALALDLKGYQLTYDKKAHNTITAEKISCLLSEGLPEGGSEG